VGAYVELIRNTPFIVQLFFIFFGLPSLGVKLCARGGLGARDGDQPRRLCGRDRARRHRGTPRGQIEAARSLALSALAGLLRVVLPPALAGCGRRWSARSSS
jgi:polar amino acid transport system permease protein